MRRRKVGRVSLGAKDLKRCSAGCTATAAIVRAVAEQLEQRVFLSLTLRSSYDGLVSGNPPDTGGAAGPNSYIETVNWTIGIYSPKATGTTQVTRSLNNFWYTQGHLSHNSSVSVPLRDTMMVWDDQVQRFIVGDMQY